MESPVLYERREQTGIITLNRPAVRNAMNLEAIDALTEAVARAASDDIRCVVFTGAGEEAFCAGGDLKQFHTLSTYEQGMDMSLRMQRALHSLENLAVPVIGVLNGYAMGGGSEAILATDIRIAEEHASIQWRQLNFGVSLGWGGAGRLARDVGARRAMRMVLFMEALEPARAMQEGIVDEVVPRGKGLERALAMASHIASLAPVAVRVLKRTLVESRPPVLHHEAALFAMSWASRDHTEAVNAFFEKRPPRFEGR